MSTVGNGSGFRDGVGPSGSSTVEGAYLVDWKRLDGFVGSGRR